MEVLGFKTVRIEKLCLEAGFRDRLDNPRVFERAKSIQRIGILSEPMVRQKDWRVIYGHDRIAGAIRAGKTEVLVKLVDCTDDELLEIELTENLQRRHDTEAQRVNLLKLLALYDMQVEETPDDKAPLLGADRNRAKTARGIARQRVAGELGIKPESVRRKEARAKANAFDAKYRAQKKEQQTPTPVLNLIGMEVEGEFLGQTIELHQKMQRVDQSLKYAQKLLAEVKANGLPFPPARFERLYHAIHSVAAQARQERPISLCPYCKGLPGLQESCAACLNCGWLAAGQADGVPQELWNVGDKACVAHRGRLVTVKSYLKEHTQSETPAATVMDSLEDILA